MKVGLVGLGRAGNVHLAAAEVASDLEIAAVCDPSPQAREAASKAGHRAYATVAELLEGETLEGVVICAPPADHKPLALLCLEQGLHVLCEKPLAIGLREGIDMMAAARRCGRVLLVASKFRHIPAVMRAHDLIAGGQLGELLEFHVRFCSATDMSKRWNAEPAVSGGGVISDNACHVFDLASYLFGP